MMRTKPFDCGNSCDRKLYCDYLRIVATIAVMLIHTSGHITSQVVCSPVEVFVMTFFSGISGCCIPIFVMISGALLIPRDVSLKDLHGRRILRILVAFLFWSFFYAGVFPLFHLVFEKSYHSSLTAVLTDAININSHFHLWYLPMTIGLYLCLPLFKKIVESETLTYYFLLLFFVFSSAIPTTFSVLSVLLRSSPDDTLHNLQTIINYIDVNAVIGYSGYFILGFVLSTTQISRRQRYLIYAFGITGFLVSLTLRLFVSPRIESQVGNFSISALLLSSAVFVLFKYTQRNNYNSGTIAKRLSKYSFGAYLLHLFVLTVLEIIGIDGIPVSPLSLFSIELLCVVLLSFALSSLINKIPFLQKWIV